MWRSCRDILPTKQRLKVRGINIEDDCDQCGMRESAGHILWGCKFAAEVWGVSRLKLPVVPNQPQEFVDIVWEISERKPDIDWEIFVVTAWSLWNHRNALKHGGLHKDADRITKEVSEYVKEFRQENQSLSKPSKSPKSQWSLPRCGWYKINVDVAVFKESRSCGVGVVIRNEGGLMMGSMSKRVELPLKALEAEARAVQEGVQLAWELGLREIIVEGDAQVVIKALQNFETCPWPIQKVVEGSLLSLSCFKAWIASRVSKNGNEVAHLISKMAKTLSDCKIWVEDTPPIIADQVLKDVTNLYSILV